MIRRTVSASAGSRSRRSRIDVLRLRHPASGEPVVRVEHVVQRVGDREVEAVVVRLRGGRTRPSSCPSPCSAAARARRRAGSDVASRRRDVASCASFATTPRGSWRIRPRANISIVEPASTISAASLCGGLMKSSTSTPSTTRLRRWRHGSSITTCRSMSLVAIGSPYASDPPRTTPRRCSPNSSFSCATTSSSAALVAVVHVSGPARGRGPASVPMTATRHIRNTP